MGILKFKYCPRCKRGNIALDKDCYGWYESCLQCGYLQDLDGVFKSLTEGQQVELEFEKGCYGRIQAFKVRPFISKS